MQRTSASVLCETGRTWKDFSRRILYLWRSPWLPGATSFPSERGRWFPVSPGYFRAKHMPSQNPAYRQPWGSVSSEYQELIFWRTARVQKAKEIDDHEYHGQGGSPACWRLARAGLVTGSGHRQWPQRSLPLSSSPGPGAAMLRCLHQTMGTPPRKGEKMASERHTDQCMSVWHTYIHTYQFNSVTKLNVQIADF